MCVDVRELKIAESDNKAYCLSGRNAENEHGAPKSDAKGKTPGTQSETTANADNGYAQENGTYPRELKQYEYVT